MEDIHSIIVNVLSNFIWLPVGVLLAYLGFWIQVRFPNRKLWLLKDPSHLVVCVANSTTTNTGVYQRPATGVGQLRALILATRSLNQAYRRKLDIQNILLSNEPLQERIENDLLILGGSQNNETTAKLLELLHGEQPARMIGRMIIWRTNYVGERWVDQGALEYEGHAVNRKIVMDYGLIVRTYNPFTSHDRTAILFAGSHTYGTIAAAKFFTEDLHKHLRKLTRNGRKNLVVLVSAHIVNGYPTKMSIERSYAW
ncbi:MAG: hypothetical protein H0V70_10035 [Ktedonobacteraceae bacterium]|nr:hypothetical protein [Ktedonobacteraceae bacterium]